MASACDEQPVTSLLVSIDGPSGGAAGITVALSGPGGLIVRERLPRPGSNIPFALPGSVLVHLADDVGDVRVDVETVSAVGTPLATGSAPDAAQSRNGMQYFAVPPRRQTNVFIRLVPGSAMPDAGADAIPDGGAGTDAGAPEAGAGQADGPAGSADVAGPEGLAVDALAGPEPGPEAGPDQAVDPGVDASADPAGDPAVDPGVEPLPDQTSEPTCNEVTGGGCGSGQKCTVRCSSGTPSMGCGPAGTRTEGQSCSGDSECAPGYVCVSSACRKFCRVEADCSSSQNCSGTMRCSGGTMQAPARYCN